MQVTSPAHILVYPPETQNVVKIRTGCNFLENKQKYVSHLLEPLHILIVGNVPKELIPWILMINAAAISRSLLADAAAIVMNLPVRQVLNLFAAVMDAGVIVPLTATPSGRLSAIQAGWVWKHSILEDAAAVIAAVAVIVTNCAAAIAAIVVIAAAKIWPLWRLN